MLTASSSWLIQRLLFPLSPWDQAFSQTYTAETFEDAGAHLLSIPRMTRSFNLVYEDGLVVQQKLRDNAVGYFPALWVPYPRARFTCLFFHANGENLGHLQECAKLLSYTMRSNVFVPEYPGYGNFNGKGVDLSTVRMEQTAADSVAYLRKANCSDSRIVLFGRSLGSGPCSYLASVFPNFRGVFLLCPFTNIEGLAAAHVNGDIISLNRAMIQRNNHMFNNLERSQKIGKFRMPYYVVVCKNDTLCPSEMGTALVESYIKAHSYYRRHSLPLLVPQPLGCSLSEGDSPKFRRKAPDDTQETPPAQWSKFAAAKRDGCSLSPVSSPDCRLVTSRSKVNHDIRFYRHDLVQFKRWLEDIWESRWESERVNFEPLQLDESMLPIAMGVSTPICLGVEPRWPKSKEKEGVVECANSLNTVSICSLFGEPIGEDVAPASTLDCLRASVAKG